MLGIAAAVNVTPVCLSSISDTFGLDYSEQGLLLGCTFWGFIAALLTIAPLSDRLGPRPFFYSATVLQCAGFALFAVAWDSWVLVIGALMAGFGAGVLETILTPVICETFPERRTSAVNALHAFYALGAAGVILVSRTILQMFDPPGAGEMAVVEQGYLHGWQWVYVAMIAIPLAYGVGFWFCLRIRRVSVLYPSSESYTGTLSRLRRWGFLLFVAGILCGAGAELGAAQWLPSYLENVMGWQRENSAVGLMVLSLAMGVGRILAGRIERWMSATDMLILAGAVCAGCLVTAGVADSALVVLSAFGVMGFFVGWMWPTIMALASEAFPHTGASMFAFLAVVGNAGGIIFPGIMGFTAETAGLRAAMISLSFVPCILMILFLTWRFRSAVR